MATITVAVKNTTSNEYTVHVFDLFANGRREIFDPRFQNEQRPFYLAENEVTPSLTVNAEADLDLLKGKIAFSVENGPSNGHIDVVDGQIVEIT